LREGYTALDFNLPDLNGNMISLSDRRFDDKIVIVQLLGSWCINCMDETKFLANWYKENNDKPLEIVGIAFERKDDLSYAKQQLSRHINRFDVTYPILFGGPNNKGNIQKTLPALENFSAFPTTIFIDKKKQVRKIHTGFSGPGTGRYYDEFVKDFNEFVEVLVKE
jgi:thiol-disulfide isomerase/thioredoxin